MAKILFLSASIGAGHVMAAKALEEAVKASQPDSTTRQVDVLTLIPDFLRKICLRLYFKSLALWPALYGSAYNWGNKGKSVLCFKEIFYAALAKRLESAIRDFSPDCIVCTHAAPSGAVSYLSRKRRCTVPHVSVVTDYVIHRLWIQPEIQAYFLAHPSLKKDLLMCGVPEEKLFCLGIPIRSAFTRRIDREKILARYGLKEQAPLILLAGGGAGLFPMEQIFSAIERIERPLQLLFITGNNKHLLKRMKNVVQGSRHEVRVLGFTEDIASLMGFADLLISKPGGLTCAEAVARSLPMLMYRPLVGQETHNAAFLENARAAICFGCPEELPSILENLLFTEPALLQEMRMCAAAIAQPQAAERISEIILKKIL